MEKIISIYDIYIYIFVPYIFVGIMTYIFVSWDYDIYIYLSVGIMTYIFVPNHQPDYIYIIVDD